MDRRILLTIVEKFGGGPVGVETIAAAVGEERDTIEDVYEPFLLQEGFLQRTPRGRIATAARLRVLRARLRPARSGQSAICSDAAVVPVIGRCHDMRVAVGEASEFVPFCRAGRNS